MAEIKYTKTELRLQQVKLTQLQKYLPTLQLKKAMLQVEINQVMNELERLQKALSDSENKLKGYSQLLSEKETQSLLSCASIVEVRKKYENIAGVEIPHFEEIVFESRDYALFDTPYWIDQGISDLRHLVQLRGKIEVSDETKRLLEKELREVSIRVNLFEKVMIPRTQQNIKKIKIFLGDQQLAAVSQAKVAKRKILERKGAA